MAKSRNESKPTSSRSKTSPRGRAKTLDDALARLERDIPKLLRQLRRNVQELQRQVDRARTDGEKRWQKAERKIKQDATRLRSRLEGAIGRIRGPRKAKASGPRRKTGVAAKGAAKGAATSPKKRRGPARKRPT